MWSNGIPLPPPEVASPIHGKSMGTCEPNSPYFENFLPFYLNFLPFSLIFPNLK